MFYSELEVHQETAKIATKPRHRWSTRFDEYEERRQALLTGACFTKSRSTSAAERERLTKELAKYEKDLQSKQSQLGNEAFLAKAPANIVEGLARERPS